MAGRPVEALALLAIGVRSLSMPAPGAIGPVKAMIRSLDLNDAAGFMNAALTQPDRPLRYVASLRRRSRDRNLTTKSRIAFALSWASGKVATRGQAGNINAGIRLIGGRLSVRPDRAKRSVDLRDQRESRGLDLTQVEKSIRIRRAHLEAIEDGRYDELPGAAYIPAFLRAYASHVGLDPEKVMTAYHLSGAVPHQASGRIARHFLVADRRAPIGLLASPSFCCRRRLWRVALHAARSGRRGAEGSARAGSPPV